MERPSVDIVLPFVGSDEELSRTVDKLHALQTRPGDTTTVVDNRPGQRPLVHGEHVLQAPERQSSYFARNAGVARGSAPWIVFLDADVTAPADLIERYFAEPIGDDVGLLIGSIHDAQPSPAQENAFAARYAHSRASLDHARRERGRFTYGQTANVAVRRSALEAVGGFDDTIRSGGDADFCFRLVDAGWTLSPRYEAEVQHHGRSSVSALMRQHGRYGSGSAWLEERYPGFSPAASPAKVGARVLRDLGRSLVALLRGDVEEAKFRLADMAGIFLFELGRRAPNEVAVGSHAIESAEPPGAVRNAGLYAAGLAMGSANTVRHRMQGYVNPRPFAAEDVDRTLDHAFEVVDRWERHGEIDWSGLRVLECGPGSDMATGAVILARGAESYTAVDLFDNRGQAASALYDRLAERLGTQVDPSAMQFVQATFPGIPEVDGPFDLVVSNATLEHIEEMPALFASFKRCGGPGARMVHHVDAQTHMRRIKDVDPLNILRYSDFVYERLLAFPGAPNRLRSGDYEAAATAAGWTVDSVVPEITADAGYVAATKVAPRFREARGLELLAFTLVASE